MNDVELIYGDCLAEMMKLPKGCVDMVFCDPPYGFFSDGLLKWDIALPFDKMWECLEHVCKTDAVIVLMGQEPFSSHLRLSVNKKGNPFSFRFDWIWEKEKGSNFQISAYQPMRVHEFCHVFYQKFRVFHQNGERLKKPYTRTHKEKTMKHLGKDGLEQNFTKTYTHKQPKSIIRCGRGHGIDGTAGQHPTQKPVGLITEVIKHHSNEGDRVLDFCAGSGSTGVACVKTGRKVILIERDHEYMQVIRERMAKPIVRECAKADWANNMPLAQARLFDD